MNYLISKPAGDTRKTTCGVVIPDGGFFVVVSLTFKNQRQIQHVKQFGYNVTETDLPEGHYTPEGLRVTRDSLHHWSMRDGDLKYIDEKPVDGVELAMPKVEIKPPDVSLRPEPRTLEEVGEENVPLPPGVAAARKRLEEQGVDTVAAKGRKKEDETIPAEDDVTTLASATSGPVDELAMLRAACEAQGITYTKSMNRTTLRKKLEQAGAA